MALVSYGRVIVGAALVVVGCAAQHQQTTDADVDASGSSASLPEGVKRCASDADCSSAWPICRCDARCWGSPAAGPPEHGPTPRIVTYLIGGLRIVEDASAAGAFGIDLDATTGGPAGSCTGASDFTSPIDGDPGVDDQLQAFLRYGEHVGSAGYHYCEGAGSIGGSTLAGMQVGEGRGWFLQVSDIDSFDDDCYVHVVLGVIGTVSGMLELGTVCDAHTDEASCHADERDACLWSPTTSTCRGIAGAQAVRIVAVSGQGEGRIGGSVLRTGPIGQTQLELLAFMGMGEVATQIYDTRIEAHIDETALTAGQLGGAVPMDSLATFAGFLATGGPGPTFTPEELEAMVQPDLAPDASGHCTSVSAGFAFDALAVEVAP